MDIRTELLKEHSKTQTLKIVTYIGNDKERLANLMDLFLNDIYRVSQRASWVVSHYADHHPNLYMPYLEQMILNLENPVHDAVLRNTLRVLQDIDVPEQLLGILADKCFNYLMDPKKPIAIRVFSMTVLYNICKKERDLKGELQLVIEDHMPHGSAGFRSRGKKILKALQKL